MALDTIVGALGDQQAELATLLDHVDESDWLRPSRCAGWTVCDVVLHLAQTDELATASVQDRFLEAVQGLSAGIEAGTTVDDWADHVVSRERGAPGDAVRERWQQRALSLRTALAACDPHDRVPWVAGDLSARTLATTRLAETWIHTGDVAFGFGVRPAPTGRIRHIARLAWRTLPYAFARAGRTLSGPVAFELRGPDGDEWRFEPEGRAAVTIVRGDAAELCLVAGRRVAAADTALRGEGPDAEEVLELVRTFA